MVWVNFLSIKTQAFQQHRETCKRQPWDGGTLPDFSMALKSESQRHVCYERQTNVPGPPNFCIGQLLPVGWTWNILVPEICASQVLIQESMCYMFVPNTSNWCQRFQKSQAPETSESMLTIACENIRNAAAYFALLLCDFATETSIICGASISCPHKMLIQNQASKSSHTPLLPCHPLVISHGNVNEKKTQNLYLIISIYRFFLVWWGFLCISCHAWLFLWRVSKIFSSKMLPCTRHHQVGGTVLRTVFCLFPFPVTYPQIGPKKE